MQYMHPPVAPLVPQIAFGLGDLIGVMGECVVNAAAVDVQILAQVLHGDAAALNVPAGITHTPGGIPFQGLVFKLGFGKPEDKVVAVALVGVFLDTFAYADIQIVGVEVIEHVVALQLRGVEIDVSAGKIGITGVHEPGNDFDVLVNTVGGRLHYVRPLDVELAAVLEEGVGIKLRNLHHALVLASGALEHLVFALVRIGGQVSYIRDVHDALDRVSDITQILLQHVFHDIGAEIADVGIVIDRRAAGVHLDDVRMVRDEQLFLPACRVVQIHAFLPFRQSMSRKTSLFFTKYSAPL